MPLLNCARARLVTPLAPEHLTCRLPRLKLEWLGERSVMCKARNTMCLTLTFILQAVLGKFTENVFLLNGEYIQRDRG